jgi:hypothetical protein
MPRAHTYIDTVLSSMLASIAHDSHGVKVARQPQPVFMRLRRPYRPEVLVRGAGQAGALHDAAGVRGVKASQHAGQDGTCRGRKHRARVKKGCVGCEREL